MKKKTTAGPVRTAACILTAVLALTVSAPGTAWAAEPSAVQTTESTPEPTADPHPAAYYEPASTDSIPSWPASPAIYAESGILVDLDTGKILYAKNMDKQLYPASITKIMTTLLAIENCAPDEQVTFSQTAIDSIPWDSSNMGCLTGETLSMEQCWYGMMLQSANEVCSGVAEHVAGSIDGFVEMMNQKAASLGCTNTHFANPNGLPDENHYTTAHDMALIAEAAFANETFRTVTGTTNYQIPATEKYHEIRYLTNHHKMLLNGSDYYYEGSIGGKTGYTEAALNTLVTFARRDDRTLLCVTMRTEGRQVYVDTASLFDYGFTNTFPDEGASCLAVPETNGEPQADPTNATDDSASVTAAPLIPEEPAASSPRAEKDTGFPLFGIILIVIFIMLLLLLALNIAIAVKRRRNRKRRRKGARHRSKKR